LPKEFLDEFWSFINKYGYDGTDQLFVSSPRYADCPEALLAKLQHNAGDSVPNPRSVAQDKISRRQQVQSRQLKQASSGCFAGFLGTARKVQKRNEQLDHLMWLRNSPKIHMSEMTALTRWEILKAESELLEAGRFEEKGDVFHLKLDELDQAMRDPSFDVQAKLAPRKAQFRRACAAKACPMLIDSRCRILKPNTVASAPGTLVGAAISPGAATGRVRIVMDPTEQLEEGEVLAAIVTDPAWTPLFVGSVAVVLQIGGALQHGALCAREYGKPAVSNIDVMAELKTGMLVQVDGNTGVVKILDDLKESPTKRLSSQRSISSRSF